MLTNSTRRAIILLLTLAAVSAGAQGPGWAASKNVDLDGSSANGNESNVSLTIQSTYPATVRDKVTNKAINQAFRFSWQSAGPGGFFSEAGTPTRPGTAAGVGAIWDWQTTQQIFAFQGTTCTNDICFTRTLPAGELQRGPFGVPGRSLTPSGVTVSNQSLTSSLLTFFSPPTELFRFTSQVQQVGPGVFQYNTIYENLGTDPIVFDVAGSPPGCVGSFCGNNIKEFPEDCDGTDLGEEGEGPALFGGSEGEVPIPVSCSTFGGSDGPEGGLSCDSKCFYDLTDCIDVCGNGIREGKEQCDGGDLGGVTCGDIQGGGGGLLGCTSSCEFDLSICTDVCGNGVVEYLEDCDGEDLAGHSCADIGQEGTVGCDSECSVVYSGCTFICGNGAAEGDEDCDGADFNDATCASLPIVQTFNFPSFGPGTICTDGGGLGSSAALGCAIAANGDAAPAVDLEGRNVLRLTPSVSSSGGSAWYISQVPVKYGFETTFQFRFSEATSPPADGIAFVVQNNSLSALGGLGGGIGYNNIINSLAVEIDTFENGYGDRNDPNGNHAAIQSCGSGANSASHDVCTLALNAFPGPSFADGQVHTATVTYRPPACSEGCDGEIRVFFDGSSTPALTAPFDLTQIGLGGPGEDSAWIGFTSATGFFYETHDILSWTFAFPGASSGTLVCGGDCTIDSSGCTPSCGNGTREGVEQCDGEDLDDHSCSDIDQEGTVSCAPQCVVDYSGCSYICGNDVIDPGEACDGEGLGGATCESFGGSGDIACSEGCTYDLTGCESVCGNGVIEPENDEQCEGENVGDHSCAEYGREGTLGCTSACQLDPSTCDYICGNGVAEPGEDCDEDDLRGLSCGNFGLVGTLRCAEKGGTLCFFDFSECTDPPICEFPPERIELDGDSTVRCRIEAHPAKEITSQVVVCGGGIPEGDPLCSAGASASQGTANVFVPDTSIIIGDVYMTPYAVVVNDPGGDGLPQPGETVNLFITLINAGSADFTNVHATLTAPPIDLDQDGTLDPITIVEGEADYEDCPEFSGDGTDCSSPPPPLQTCTNLTAFLVTFPAGHPIDINRPFVLTLTGDIGDSELSERPGGQTGGINLVPITVGVAGFCDDAAQAACDDMNPCTTDSCSEAEGCIYTNNTGPCDDGDSCTTGDTCADGQCVPGSPTTLLPFADPFTSPVLGSCWAFIDPVGDSTYTLPDGEHIKITVPQGTEHDCWNSGANCARIVRDVPNTDAVYETKIDGMNISLRNQDYGIIFFGDDCNHVRFQYWSGLQGVHARIYRVLNCVGQGPLRSTPSPIVLGASNYLRVIKTGDSYRFEYRIDDGPWTLVGTQILTGFDLNQAGFFVLNAVNNPMNMAIVDYFNATPVTPHTLRITRGPLGDPNPVASAGTVNLMSEAEDSQGHLIAYRWSSQCDLPANGSFSSTAAQSPQFFAPVNTTGVPRTCVVKLIVEDPFGLTDMGHFELMVNPAHAIVVTDGPSGSPNPVASGGMVGMTVSAFDTFGHTLTYRWSSVCSFPNGGRIWSGAPPTTEDGASHEGAREALAVLPRSTVNPGSRASEPAGSSETPLLGHDPRAGVLPGPGNGTFDDDQAQNPTWTAPTNDTASTVSCAITVLIEDGMGLMTGPTYTQFVAPQGGACGTFPVNDEFTGPTLDPCWVFSNPAGGTSSLDSGHEVLQVLSGSSHDCWNASPSCARLLRPVPNADAVYETRIDGVNLTSANQDYGILLYQNDTNYLRFEFWTMGSGTYVRAYKVINGVGVLPPSITTASPISVGSSNYLRVTKTGSTYALAYSTNGMGYTTVGSLTQAGFVVGHAGLFVNNAITNPLTTGNFDYFTATALGPPGDTTPPVRMNGQPTGPLPAGTTQATLSLATDENATCRYGTVAGTPYESLTPFTTTGGTSHSTLVPVSDGNSYSFYVRCRDASPNANTNLDDFAIAFSVSSPGPFPFLDPFTGAPVSGWTFSNPAGGSQTPTADHLQLSVSSGSSHDCWNISPNCARLLRSFPNQNAVYETKIDGTNLGAANQDYGILLFQNPTNYFRFEFWNGGSGTYVRAYRVINGTGVLPPTISTASPVALGAANSLRVTKSGNIFTLEYKIDGGGYVTAGSFTQAGFTVNQAGLFVNNAITNPATTGNFDFFSATAGP